MGVREYTVTVSQVPQTWIKSRRATACLSPRNPNKAARAVFPQPSPALKPGAAGAKEVMNAAYSRWKQSSMCRHRLYRAEALKAQTRYNPQQ